jgi:hypothetical protein
VPTTIRRLMCAVMFAVAFSGLAEEPKVELLRVGQFHGKEVTAQSCSEWFALVRNEDGCVLRRVEVEIQTVFDPIMDAEGEATGKQVRVDLDREPLFLVRGFEFCMPGEIPAVSLEQSFVYPAQEVRLTLDRGATWRLRGYGSVERGRGLSIRNYTLELAGSRHGDPGQVIHAVDGGVELGEIYPIWAGDLDLDGSIDLLLETGNHYNVMEYTLYLSSAADEGELVKRVAVFRTVGC